MPPGAAAPQDPGRVRFLRACDRCRSRKIKCGNENPCSKCVAAKATCSFSSSGSQGRSLLSSAEQIGAATDVESSPTEAGPSVNKRRLSSSSGDDPSGKKRSSTRGNSTHFFLSSHGIPHHAGSSSGLPLLEATRRLASDTAGEQKQAGMPDLDWQWLQDLLSDGDTASVRNSDGNGQPEADEYFPGRDIAHSSAGDELLSSIQDIIPADLLNDLLGIFFSTIHPVWPIMHIPTFFEDLQQLREHSFSALVVSMCMLASRYSSDPRVFTDPENPATAGVRYYELFNRLIEHAVNSDHVIYAIKGRFFASMFHCVDNVPHPVAQGLFADALSRTLDGGLHRHVSAEIWGNPVVREVRSRVAWAIYTWDKQIAAFCGRPFLNGLWDMDVRLPEPFHYEHWHSPEWPIEKDKEYVANFRQLIQLSGVLEFALRASVDRPIVENSSFLTDLARQSRPALDDTSRLDITMAALRKWRSSAPPAVSLPLAKDRSHLPEYSVASEQVASIYQMVQLLVAARALQVETSCSKPDTNVLESHRAAVVDAARDMVGLVVQLGFTHHLRSCDILVAYRLLFAGRLLLACVLSARAQNHHAHAEEATRILHATSVALRNFVALFPVALGAAEVLDETIRVCQVCYPLSSNKDTSHPGKRYAWYRPIAHQTGIHIQHSSSTAKRSNENGRPPETVVDGQVAEDDTLAAAAINLGNVPLSIFNSDLPQGTFGDFSWLMPGSDNLPYYFPSSGP